MLRIVLTPADLASVRFEADPRPLVDAGLAARALRRRPSAPLAHWHAATRPALGDRARLLLALTPPAGPTCSFVQPLCADLDAGLVATTRAGRGVRHWLTPLGAQLLHAVHPHAHVPGPRVQAARPRAAPPARATARRRLPGSCG